MTTAQDKQVAAIVAKLKAGEPLTEQERTTLETYRTTRATADQDRFIVELLAIGDAYRQPTRRYTADDQDALRQKVEFCWFGKRIESTGDERNRKAE